MKFYRWLSVVTCLWLALAEPGLAGNPAQGPTASQAVTGRPSVPVALAWSVARNVFPPDVKSPQSLAQFSFKALTAPGLPAGGWSLYFTCIAEVVLGATEDGLATIEHVNGTLYRLRPTERFSGVGPGQTVNVQFFHPDLMFRPDKAPRGPYLVWDAQPDVALAWQGYHLEPLTRPEQLSLGPGQPPVSVTAEEIFQRNAGIYPTTPDQWPPVFPTPQRWQTRAGTLVWRAMPRIVAAPRLRGEAEVLRSMLRAYWPAASGPSAATAIASSNTVRLALRRQRHDPSPEAYSLRIDPQRGLELTGASPQAVFRGLQSLRELLPALPPSSATPTPLALPALEIQDAPRFAYRGLLLDVARSFHPKETVFRLVDLMARYKLNKLHLHLTDDEGWRLAIAGLPELTTVGARRGHGVPPWDHLPPAHGSGPYTDTLHGSGYYRADDYIDILRYAAARHVEVIPEIEMPGHARAAVRAMEVRARRLQAERQTDAVDYRLADPQDRSVYRSPQLHTDHLMDPGLESTYRFIDHVVREVVRLHRQAGVPLRTLHVGADELPAGAWAGSPSAQSAIARGRLAGLPGLWDHFYDRVQAIVKRHGVAVAGWEELGARRQSADGNGPLVPNEHFKGKRFTLFVWNNLDDADDLAYRLANAGYRTVLAPATALYFDMAHHRDPSEPGVNWATVLDLDAVFNYSPMDALRVAVDRPGTPAGKTALSEVGRRHIVGLEATLFSEIMHTQDQIDYLLMPRMLGLAERAWSPDPAWAREADPAKAQALHAQAWSIFTHHLGTRVLPRLSLEMPSLRWRIPAPGLRRQGEWVQVNVQLPGLDVRYTTDGSDPTWASERVSGPIRAVQPVRAATFAPDGRRSAVSFTGPQ